MCNVDTGLLGQVWANAQDPAAFPDFNTRHRCKNFDQVREWADRLQVCSKTSSWLGDNVDVFAGASGR